MAKEEKFGQGIWVISLPWLGSGHHLPWLRRSSGSMERDDQTRSA